MFFIGPPFGNYIRLPDTVPIKGSFTLEERTGLLMQIYKTLYYSKVHEGWVNKIGLRNKGIDYAIKDFEKGNKNDVYSIAVLKKEDIPILVKKIPENMNIELNVSCPNAEKKMETDGLEQFLNPLRRWCIVKLSPTVDSKLVDKYYNVGFRQFHCSNTIPVEDGGLSGRKIIPYTDKHIMYIRKHYPNCEIIAGGGVNTWGVAKHYSLLGANHFAASTVFFNPLLAGNLYINYRMYKNRK